MFRILIIFVVAFPNYSCHTNYNFYQSIHHNIPNDRFSNFDIGLNRICAIRVDGSLFCGSSSYDYGSEIAKNVRLYLKLKVGRDSDWSKVSVGCGRACALKVDGSLYCWHFSCEEKDGTIVIPKKIKSALGWMQVSVGCHHACAIKNNGDMYCWGKNDYGQIGDGTLKDKERPERVGKEWKWIIVAAGLEHTCAINSEHRLFCWGKNNFGQLGNSTFENKNLPCKIDYSNAWKYVGKGILHTCAISEDGLIYCWGFRPAYGAKNEEKASPEKQEYFGNPKPWKVSEIKDWVTVEGGVSHTCGIRSDNSLYCWGVNMSGLTNKSPNWMPTRVNNRNEWKYVRMNLSNTCAIDKKNELYCWQNRKPPSIPMAPK